MGNSREVHCRGFGFVLNNSFITQKNILLCRDSSIYLLINLSIHLLTSVCVYLVVCQMIHYMYYRQHWECAWWRHKIFHIIVLLWREPTGHRWFSLTKASVTELRFFSSANKWLSKHRWRLWDEIAFTMKSLYSFQICSIVVLFTLTGVNKSCLTLTPKWLSLKTYVHDKSNETPGTLLLTWFYLSRSTDKWSHIQQNVGWNYSSFPKLQRCNGCSLE